MRVGFAMVIGFYGGWRVFSGINVIRKAAEAEGKIILNGKAPVTEQTPKSE